MCFSSYRRCSGPALYCDHAEQYRDTQKNEFFSVCRNLSIQKKVLNAGRNYLLCMSRTKLRLVCCLGFVFSLLVLSSSSFRRPPTRRNRHPSVPVPWQNVGGCGSGSGSAHPSYYYRNDLHPPLPSDTNYHLGAHVDYIQLLGQDLQRSRLSLVLFGRFGGFASYLAIPIVFREKTVLTATSLSHTDSETKGLGDIEAGFRYHTPYLLPPNITMPIELSLVFPTGQYALTRGPEFAESILPADLQRGRGVWEAILGIKPSLPIGRVRLASHTGIRYPFNISFSGRNEFLDTWYTENRSYKDSTDSDTKSRFYYRFKPYGENDIGDYYPPSLFFEPAVSASFSERLEHFWRSKLEFPLGTTWLHNYYARVYDPHPNPDHRAWRFTLHYDLQLTIRPVQSIFSISLPLYDKPPKSAFYTESDLNTWDSPDWTEFMQSWSFGVRLRITDGLIQRADK